MPPPPASPQFLALSIHPSFETTFHWSSGAQAESLYLNFEREDTLIAKRRGNSRWRPDGQRVHEIATGAVEIEIREVANSQGHDTQDENSHCYEIV